MPENPTSFSRNFEDYSAILGRMAKSSELHTLYERYNEKLKALNETIASLTGADNDTPLAGEQLQAIKAQYREAINVTAEYIRISAGTSSGSAYVAGEVERVLRKDMAVIDRIPESSTVRLSDAFRKARSTCVDVGTATFRGVGGGLSFRFAVKYTDADGVTRQGFFTPNNRIGDYTGLVKMYKARFPQYNDLWDGLLVDPEGFNKAVSAGTSGELLLFSGKPGDPALKAVGLTRLTQLTQISESRGHLKSFAEMLIKQISRDSTYSSKVYLNADAGSSVTDRNCAMSTVADMLGLSAVLAKSEKMVMVRNGRRIEGCFMDTAEGYDGNNLNTGDPNNPMWKWVKKSVENDQAPPVSGNAMRQMADLQVLDYICGNVDRHMYNRLYKFSVNEQGEPVLDGVVGIDNDNAFGKDSLMLEGNQHNAGLKALGVISASTARKIMELSSEKLGFMLSDYGLSHGEKQAVAKRLEALQWQIQQSRVIGKETKIPPGFQAENDVLYVVEDERFGDLKPDMLTLKNVARMGGYGRGMRSNAFDHITESLADEVHMDYTQVGKDGKIKTYTPSTEVYTTGTLAEGGPVTREDILERFNDLHRTAKELYKQAWWNTEEFKAMSTALDSLAASQESTDVERMMELCTALQEKTKDYISKKKDAPDTNRGRERLSFARRLQDACADLKDEYNDGLLRTGQLPQIKKSAAPVVGKGDQLFENMPLQEQIEYLEMQACGSLSQGLLLNNNDVLVTAVAQLLHYNSVRIYSRTVADPAVAEGMLEGPGVDNSIAAVREVAQDFVTSVGVEGLEELLNKTQPAQRINDEVAKRQNTLKKTQQNTLPKTNSRDKEMKNESQTLKK